MLRLHRGDHGIDGAALESMHGRGPCLVDTAQLLIAGGEVEHAPVPEAERHLGRRLATAGRDSKRTERLHHGQRHWPRRATSSPRAACSFTIRRQSLSLTIGCVVGINGECR